MDSTNNNANTAEKNELDIRDVANFLLGKIWIIILAMVCLAVVAIIFTSTITPKYTSQSTMFITNTQASSSSSSQTMSDWNVGKQLAITSPELFTDTFCKLVAAEMLSNSEFVENVLTPTNLLANVSEENKVSALARIILASTTVTSDDKTCIVTFTVTTTNQTLSMFIANATASEFGKYINDFMDSETIRTVVAKEGTVSSNPSNIHYGRNTVLAAAVGAILACAVLIVIFIFDDKIKTPDDIDRYLGLSVLGVIPEIDVEG